MRVSSGISAALALTALVVASPVRAQFVETETNDTKALANSFTGLVPGSTITGNSTGTTVTGTGLATSADTFLISTAANTPGIYQYRLTLTTAGTAGHTGTIRGLTQTFTEGGGVPGVITTTDTTLQTSATTPARFNQWYGFGQSEQIYYRVTGTATTTSDYVATLSSTLIVPSDIGNYAAGSITFDTIGRTGATQTDTDFAILDGNFNPIAGYLADDEGTSGTSAGGRLTRNYAPGTYYLAISNYNTASNLAAAADDGFGGAVLDFPNALVNTSTGTNVNVGFGVTDANGLTTIGSTKVGAFDVNYYKFTVGATAVPEPGSVALLASGLVMMGGVFVSRRRKASSAA